MKLQLNVREVVRQHTIPQKYTLALLRHESEQQIALAKEVMEKR